MIFSLSPLGSESRFVGWRFAALIGGIVGAIALAMYPIAVDPYFNPDKYSKTSLVIYVIYFYIFS